MVMISPDDLRVLVHVWVSDGCNLSGPGTFLLASLDFGQVSKEKLYYYTIDNGISFLLHHVSFKFSLIKHSFSKAHS